jgi:PhnB protein
MSLTNTTHVNFRGDARAALEFYADVFGGTVTIVTFGDAHAAERPEEADLVMWGQAAADSGFRIMAFDVPASREFERGSESFFESVRTGSVEELTALWEKLADGATIRTPLGPSAWAPAYGMLTDRFGVTWVMDVEVAYDPA